MTALFSRLGTKRTLIKNIGVVASGTLAAQVINFVGYASSAHFLSPTDFGFFAAEVAISTPLSIIATGRYEAAFIRAHSSDQVINLLSLVCIIFALFLTAAGIIVFSVGFLIKSIISIDIFYVSLMLFSQSFMNSTTQLMNYNEKYNVIAISRIIGALATQSIIISLSALHFGYLSLVFGFSSGLILSSFIFIISNRDWIISHRGSISMDGMLSVMGRYIGLSLFNAPQALASALQDSAAIALVSLQFGASGAGLYSLNGRLLRAPINIAAESVGRVLQRYFATIANQAPVEPAEVDSRLRFLRESIYAVIAMGMVFALAAWVFAPMVIDYVFDARWAELGGVVRAASGYYGAWLAASALAAIPVAVGANYRLLALMGTMGSALYVLLFAVAGSMTSDLAGAFLVVSMIMTPYFLVFILIVYNLVSRRIGR